MMTANHIPLKMLLSNLLEGFAEVTNLMSIVIEDVVLDSRQSRCNSLFIAVPGLTVDGRQFIDAAIEQGASAVLWECEQGAVPIPVAWRVNKGGVKVPVIAIESLSDKVGRIADRFYQEPSKSMQVVGITGTNGKTSCSHFIAHALSDSVPTGVMGTLGWGQIDNLHTNSHTTPDVVTCHKWLAEMQQQNVKCVAMEVSSHALDQGRVDNIVFNSAVFTNLTHDHLDYHGGIEEYARAKERLFSMPGLRYAVINCDDAYGRDLLSRLDHDIKILSYGLKKESTQPDIYANNIVQTEAGLEFDLHTPIGDIKIDSPVYGLFNIYNLLATVGILLINKTSLEDISVKLKLIHPVNGRMSIVQQDVDDSPTSGCTIIIDYAHTPDALKQALLTVREHFSQPIWCVFGCGGDRDKEKRPIMGAIANELAEHIIITSDNPRNEDAQVIIDEIVAGVSHPENIMTISDRREAIYSALDQANDGEVVFIAGKGHESYQQIGETRLPFSDASVVADFLKRLPL